MVEKQWFGCHADWTPGFWTQNDISQADFLTPATAAKPAWCKTYRVHGSPSQPSKIILWMYQVNWDGWEAMVWVPCWLDTWILYPQNGISQADFLTPDARLIEPRDPPPNHPQSFCGHIKWIGMVEKQWFGCHADWTPRFWPQNDILQADFLTSSSTQTVAWCKT
jgi:hypothetical protein